MSEAVAITFVLTSIASVIIGTTMGCIITYCIMKRKITTRHQQNQSVQAMKGPLYETVSEEPKLTKREMEMGANVAYGPVKY